MASDESARALLGWHHLRRVGGVPTVGVLVGPTGLGVRAWRAWAAGEGRPVVQVPPDDLAAAAATWLAGVDLTALAARWVAARTGRPAPDPAAMTRYDLDRLWQTLPAGTGSVAAVAHCTLAAAVTGAPVDFHGVPAADVFAGVCGLDPAAAWPALLLVPGDAAPPGWFDRAVRDLDRVSNAAPVLPVGVCVPADVFDAAARVSTRPMALAREGVVRLAGVTAAELLDRLRAAGVEPPPSDATVARLTRDGLAPDVADAFVEAAVSARNPDPAAGARDGFRSKEERFLFEQLESMPATAGRFRGNQRLDFNHGQGRAEADLVAPDWKLVVEVDGEYYHLTREAYRRDRRKDDLYQRHGYWVLRFLAGDVVDDLENILNTILTAVESRRSALPPEAPARA